MNTTTSETEELSIREVIKNTLHEELERDEDVFIQGVDVSGRGGLADLGTDFGEDFKSERVRNTPISESAVVGSGLGAAATGMRPIVEVMYSGFLGVPMDQIMNQVAKMRYMFGGELDIPLTIRTQNTSDYSAAAQHSQALHQIMSSIPGIKVVCTSTPYDMKGLLKSAIRSDDPVMVFEHTKLYNKKGEVPVEDYTIPIGEAAVEREGEDVTVVATQSQLWKAFDAADELADEIDLEIISPRTFDPLDIDTIANSVKKTGRCVVADDTPLRMGTQSELAAVISEEAFFDLDFPVQRVGVDNIPVPFSPPLENEVIPQTDDIVEAVQALT